MDFLKSLNFAGILLLLAVRLYAQPPAGFPGGPQRSGQMPKANTQNIKNKYLDVAYAGKSAAQKLDIYLPSEDKGPFPVIVFIHGGAFKMGDKSSFEVNPALEGLKHGYAVVSVNYRLSGEAIFPAQIQDVKAAIRFIRANAGKYHLNSNKIASWGASAGGHLSAMVGTTGDIQEFDDASLGNATQSSQVHAVIDWFGLLCLSRWMKSL